MTDKIDAQRPVQETAPKTVEKLSPEKQRAEKLKQADACLANVENRKKRQQDEQNKFIDTAVLQKNKIISSSEKATLRELPPNLTRQIVENQKTINTGLIRLEQNAKSLGERVNFGSEIRQLLGQVAIETDEKKIQILCNQASTFFQQEVARLEDALKANKPVRGTVQNSAQTNGMIAKRISVSAQETRTRLSKNSETFLKNVQVFGRGFPDLANGINARESAFLTDNQVQLENFRTCLQSVLRVRVNN